MTDDRSRELSGAVNQTSPMDTPEGLPGVHPMEKLWREHGLPEWFLGNGGTNVHLYALYDAIRASSVAQAPTWQCHAKLRPEVSDCMWPDCGCEPRSTEIIAALVKQGWTPPLYSVSSTDRGEVG